MRRENEVSHPAERPAPPDADRPGRILDVSRLLARLHRPTPRGIDRVEFAYARHYLERADFMVTTPVNSGLISREMGRHLVRTALERWQEPVADHAAERSFEVLVDLLRSPVGTVRATPGAVEPNRGIVDHAASTVTAAAYLEAFRNGLFQRRPKAAAGSWYLHVSHANLHEAARLRWLPKAGARALFMVHDLIPISHPEYFRPEDTQAHRRRIGTMAGLGHFIIFNSTATRRAWDDCLHDMGLPTPPAAVAPLGVDPVYCDRSPVDRFGTPYFVVVGTIEARKNIGFLLHVWREWVRKAERPKARLVIVGRRAASNDTALGFLDRCPALAASVVELAELADVRVARLLKGAQALLAPSQIEGFGLPIAEALALGVPVIASDIEAHREAGGSAAEFLDPLDGRAWTQALDSFADLSSPRRDAALARIAVQKSRSWHDHFHDVESLLCART